MVTDIHHACRLEEFLGLPTRAHARNDHPRTLRIDLGTRRVILRNL